MGSCNSGGKGRGGNLGIGKRGNPKSDEYAMNNANPNYFNTNAEEEGWKHNCQSSAITFEAMMRGYDTEAVPQKKGEPFYEENGKQHKWRDSFEGKQTKMTVGADEFMQALESGDLAKAQKLANNLGVITGIKGHTVAVNTKTSIEKQMNDWGEGSRAMLSVVWKNSKEGHIINVINKGGKPIGIDAQSHEIIDLGKMLSEAKTNYTALTRVDNLKFKSNVQYLTKGKKQ